MDHVVEMKYQWREEDVYAVSMEESHNPGGVVSEPDAAQQVSMKQQVSCRGIKIFTELVMGKSQVID